MPRSRYRPRHSECSGHSVQTRVPRQPARRPPKRDRLRGRSKISSLAAGLTVVVLTAVAALMHGTFRPASDVALTATNCQAPALVADTSTDTLLGVNASDPSQLSRDTAEFGHLPIVRIYYTGMPDPNVWTTGVQAINNSAVVLSFESPPATVLSGADDAALAHFFDTAPTGHAIYYSYYAEPEQFLDAGDFALGPYKEAWAHIVAIANAARNPYLKSTLILMGWDVDPASGINWKDYLPSGGVISTMGWDAYPAGTVHDKDPQPTPPADFMGAAEAASRSAGLPFGFAEFALGTQTDRPEWLAEVANYLRNTGALFGTLFDSTGYPWMYLNDNASIQAWRAAVADDSGPSTPVTTPSAPASPARSSSPPAAASPSPARSVASLAPSPSVAAVVAPTITGARVDPEAFAPTGANHVRILFKLSQAASVTICVLSSQGAVLRQLNRPDSPAGWSSAWYLGHQTDGKLLPAGNYSVVIVANNSAGNAVAQTELTVSSG